MADRVRSLDRAGMSVLVFADAGTAALPASLLQSVAGRVTWILDGPAASLL